MCAKFRGLTRKNGVRNSRGHNFWRSIWTSLYPFFFASLSNWGAGGFSRGWYCLIWAKCTSRVSSRRTRYTTGESWEPIIYGPRHGSYNFGFGQSVSWKGLYTSAFCPGLNTGYGVSLTFSAACLITCSVKLRRVNSNANCKLSRISRANTSASAVLPLWGMLSIISTGNLDCLPHIKNNGVSCIVALEDILWTSWTNGKREAYLSCLIELCNANIACIVECTPSDTGFPGVDKISSGFSCARVCFVTLFSLPEYAL